MRRIFMGAAVLATLLTGGPALAQGTEPPSYPKLGGPGPDPAPAPAPPAPAPTPAPAGPSLEQKLTDYLAGRWVNSYVDPVGSNITTDYRFAADGTGSGSLTNTSSYGAIKYFVKGKWSMTPIDDTSFALRLEMNGDMIIRSTEEMTIVDANTLANAATKTNMKRMP